MPSEILPRSVKLQAAQSRQAGVHGTLRGQAGQIPPTLAGIALIPTLRGLHGGRDTLNRRKRRLDCDVLLRVFEEGAELASEVRVFEYKSAALGLGNVANCSRPMQPVQPRSSAPSARCAVSI